MNRVQGSVQQQHADHYNGIQPQIFPFSGKHQIATGMSELFQFEMQHCMKSHPNVFLEDDVLILVL